MMNESSLKKILAVFFVISIISLLWAIGSTSRKKVELDKSSDLYDKLKSLTKANTVITSDLKKTTNECADLKKTTKKAQQDLAAAQGKSLALEKKLTAFEQKYNNIEKELRIFKNTNKSLGEELTREKENILRLQNEIRDLKTELEYKNVKKTKKIIQKETKKKSDLTSEPKNFNW
ncbi:MAG: hypothetical protein ABII88_05415 [Candidatus Omnitrophota bacterium]